MTTTTTQKGHKPFVYFFEDKIKLDFVVDLVIVNA